MQETINQCFTIPQEQNDFDQNREYMRRHDRSRKNQIPKIGNKVIPIHTTYGYSFPHSVEQNQEKTESRLWNTLQRHHYRSQSEKKQKPMFSRPQYLLKKYLHRKQKQRFGMTLLSNPQFEDDEKPREYKTITDFRIKKPKKCTPSLMASPEIKMYEEGSTQLHKLDENFLNFTYSKNLYEMTYEQLEKSINWKKQFLQNINRKIRETKSSSVTSRMHF